jgi:predicted transcriptional regulator
MTTPSTRRLRTKATTVHLAPQTHAALAEIAERDGRSLSNKMSQLAEQAVQEEQNALESSA